MPKSGQFSRGEMPPWLVIIIAFLLAFLSAGVLSWQYYKISKGQIVSLSANVEKESVLNILERFMAARIAKNEAQAKTYFTERAMEQYLKGEFSLIDDFKSFEILKTEKLDENKFRFIVKFCEQDETRCVAEVITLVKITDRYYVDSLELAG